MSEENKKKSLWLSVEKTDPRFTKKGKKGKYEFTSPNATWQIKQATDQWGPYGSHWGLQDLEYEYKSFGQTEIAKISAFFVYPPNGKFKLNSSMKIAYITNGGKGYLLVDEDYCKKLETDILTKALSKLGFSADIFMTLYDDNKYLQEVTEMFDNKKNEEILEKEKEMLLPKFEDVVTDLGLERVLKYFVQNNRLDVGEPLSSLAVGSIKQVLNNQEAFKDALDKMDEA